VRDHETGDCRIGAGAAVDQVAQFEPIRRADRRAADLAEGDRHRIGDQPGFGEAVEQHLAGQLLPEIGIVEHIEARRTERGDRAAGADDGDARQVCGHQSGSVLTGRGTS
jgi:hypothetical protein